MITMDDVRQLAGKARDATARAMNFIRAQPTNTKRIAFFETVPVVFTFGSSGNILPEKREVTWVNPAGDAKFTEVGHETILEYTSGGSNHTVVLQDTEIGLIRPNFNAQFPVVFDFEWNFRYGRDNAQYCVESMLGGDNGYCSRKSLGNKARGQMLGWDPSDPLTILAGDSITWTILPTMLGFSANDYRAITVNLFLSGYRDGTPAEADYELR